MTNEEIILKSVQAHLTPAQRHEIAAAAYTPEQIAHAVEHIPDGLDELAAAQVHTFAWWKDNGKSVKRGEKALFTCPLWKYTDKPSKAQIKAAEAAGKEVQPAAHYYPTTSYMFSCLQVESNKPAPAGRFKSIDEIKAYNKMLAEQRRAARVSAAIHRLEAAGYTVEGWNHTTSLCTVARLDGLNTNHDKSGFWSFPTWQAAASALLD